MSLRIGSLCTGYGGLDHATEAAFGAHTAWVSDIDKGACKILAHRYPDVPNIGDMTAVDWSDVEPVDIITGGTPCQDLSHAGRRAGMTEGTRSNLWVAMRESIATIRPTYVIWENVRGAYSASADSDLEPCPGCVGDGPATHLRALGRVLGDLSELGYDTQWRGLRAADVGAPHGRFRVFVVARLADAPSHGRDEGRTESAGLVGRPDAAERGDTPADSPELTLLPTPTTQDGANTGGASQFDRNSLPLNALVTLLPTPAVNDMGKAYTPDEWDAWTAKMQAAHGNGKSLEIEAARLLPTPQADTSTTVQGGKPALQAIARDHEQSWGDYAPAIARWERVIGREAPAPTEPTGRDGAHRLSPRFTEWMMGLPDGWITDVPGITRNEALKACGNGVVPQQAFAAISYALAAEAAA